MKSIKPAEKRRLEKAYRIIESSLIEPMIIEIKDYVDANSTSSSSEESNNNQNIIENNNRKKLFRVRSSLKEKNKYYDVDIENKTLPVLILTLDKTNVSILLLQNCTYFRDIK